MREIRRIEFEGPEFSDWVKLREKVLRAPLGLVFSAQEIAAEVDEHHLCLFEDDCLAGGLILQVRNPMEIKMRQFAVEPGRQGSGIGAELLRFSETYARELGATKVNLHAREEVVPFYEKFDYQIVGERFMEVTIPHFRMEKSL